MSAGGCVCIEGHTCLSKGGPLSKLFIRMGLTAAQNPQPSCSGTPPAPRPTSSAGSRFTAGDRVQPEVRSLQSRAGASCLTCDLHVSHRMQCCLSHGPHLSLRVDPSQWLGAPAPLSSPCQTPFNRDAGSAPTGTCRVWWGMCLCVCTLVSELHLCPSAVIFWNRTHFSHNRGYLQHNLWPQACALTIHLGS